MTAPIGNNENAERGLLPYPVIIAATKGDLDLCQYLGHKKLNFFLHV